MDITVTEDNSTGYLIFHSFDALDNLEIGETEFTVYLTDEDGQVGEAELELTLMETAEYEEAILGIESKIASIISAAEEATTTAATTETEDTATEETTTEDNGCESNEEYNESTQECEAIITVRDTATAAEGSSGKGQG